MLPSSLFDEHHPLSAAHADPSLKSPPASCRGRNFSHVSNLLPHRRAYTDFQPVRGASVLGGYTKAALNLFIEHPQLDELIGRLAVEPNAAVRVRIMQEEMLPWLREDIPGVAIGAIHAIVGLGPMVGAWPLIPGHMGFHNWEYVTRGRQLPRLGATP
jgi:hypothetical protein